MNQIPAESLGTRQVFQFDGDGKVELVTINLDRMTEVVKCCIGLDCQAKIDLATVSEKTSTRQRPVVSTTGFYCCPACARRTHRKAEQRRRQIEKAAAKQRQQIDKAAAYRKTEAVAA
jgi:hypothetical protein